ncbi:MipA/OmpV family protein [Paracoccus sediminis]|uniref:MipA/OmpV family protein n=1 Tax=Paracoccus sediminis TaxID=1214787 RepID=A0A238XHS9_9RHOB|nr:MipA/OmpV family protein [Paracoccus sediminis]TBN48509.1 MipA/OmpV family protein [Paracoccus sediminis]SNR58250.1 outer membrane protein [Paracoccus sediminis]
MKHLLALTVLAASAATGAVAQDFGFAGREFSVDLGVGVDVGPDYPGSDDAEAGPWLIWRNAGFGQPGTNESEGFALSPSFGTVGEREASDNPDLAGMEALGRAYELGLRVSYGMGPVMMSGSVRRGFDGHEGLTGEVGAKYRTDLSDRVSLWSGLSLGYGNGEYNDTYFGVDAADAAPGRPAYDIGGGFNKAAITFEARYALTENTALLGEVEYGKLIGDAADSPVVQDEYQPSLKLGIVRRFSFGF